MQKSLKTPEFIKISEIRPGVHCYHAYAKIISANKYEIQKPNGRGLQILEGVLADDTSCANFKFTGAHANNISVGSVIAIRNGRSNLVDGHILLELDRFGRVSKGNASLIKDVNLEQSISTAVWGDSI